MRLESVQYPMRQSTFMISTSKQSLSLFFFAAFSRLVIAHWLQILFSLIKNYSIKNNMGNGVQKTKVIKNSDVKVWVWLDYMGDSEFQDREIAPHSSQEDEYNLMVRTVDVKIAADGYNDVYFKIPAGQDITITELGDVCIQL